MNTTAWLSALTTILVFLGAAMSLVALWVSKNKDTIVMLWTAIREIKGRIDQHDKLRNVVTTETAIQSRAIPPQTINPHVPIEFRQATVNPNPRVPPSFSDADAHAQYTPEQTAASDALSAARSRVGQVVDPHNAASAVIQAQSGLK